MSAHLCLLGQVVKRQAEEISALKQKPAEPISLGPQLDSLFNELQTNWGELAREVKAKASTFKSRVDCVSHATLFWVMALLFLVYLVPAFKMIFWAGLIALFFRRVARANRARKIPKVLLIGFIMWFFFFCVI